MINTEMLSTLRTKLDEVSASFWTDIECYRSLTDGQLELTTLLPSELLAKNQLESDLTGGSIESGKWHIARPTNVLRLLNSTFNDKPVRIIPNDYKRLTSELNTYLAASASDPIMYEVNNFYVYSPSDPVDAATITYLPILTDIDASNSCELIEVAHPAIVQYAYADLLKKSNRLEESALEFSTFIKMVMNIRGV